MSPLHPFVHQMNDVAGCTAAAAGPVAGIVVEKRHDEALEKLLAIYLSSCSNLWQPFIFNDHISA